MAFLVGHDPEVVEARTQQNMSVIAEAVNQGKCILFLGAGVHSAPSTESPYTYPAAVRPLLGKAFSQRLANKTSFEKRFPDEGIANLQRVAQDYEIIFGDKALMQEIREAVYDGKQPSDALRMLADLDFPLVITTNYDVLFERALEAVGKPPFVSVYKRGEHLPADDYPLGQDPTARRPFLFKIHGDVDKGRESIVITDEDYIQFVLRMGDKPENHPVPGTIRYYFQRYPTLFVGYSLRDYNLRLLFKTLRWKIDSNTPSAYSVDLYPDPLIFAVWHNERKFINFLTRDVWTFVPDLHRRVSELREKR